MKKYKKDFFLVFFLTALSFYVWRFLPDWIIQGQGFMYFDPRTINSYLNNPLGLLSTAQAAGVILSSFIVKLVGVNFPLYMWIQLIGMLLLGVLFYFVVKVVTKNRFIAFSASLMYTVSYFGNYAMYMVDYTAHFLERASVNVAFLLFSFLFLHLFLEKEKKKYYVISIVLYFLGVLSSHFSILFTGPYFFYPFFWHILNKKNVLKGFTIGMSYALISGFFIYVQSVGVEPMFREHVGFLQFLLHPQASRYPEAMLMSLVYWSQYPLIIKTLIYDLYPFSYFTYENAVSFKSVTIITYIIAAFLIYKVLVNKRALLLTIISGTASVFLVNIYLGRYDTIYLADTNRYLYLPTFLLVIFWSLFLWILFKNKNFALKTIGIVLLIGYYYINIYLIFLNFSRMNADARSQKAIYNHIINTRSKLEPNTLVIGPYPDIAEYEGPFFTYQLGKGEVKYMSDWDNISGWTTTASSSSHVIRLRFGIKCQCVLEEILK